eukprot:GHVN01077828.1.p1 GENE.GHVN01077828.1~~GHVN01077828.1.p1  ORF type:complete len:341 (+),score=74.24 GHVN01077828.1:526-1548(+)
MLSVESWLRSPSFLDNEKDERFISKEKIKEKINLLVNQNPPNRDHIEMIVELDKISKQLPIFSGTPRLLSLRYSIFVDGLTLDDAQTRDRILRSLSKTMSVLTSRGDEMKQNERDWVTLQVNRVAQRAVGSMHKYTPSQDCLTVINIINKFLNTVARRSELIVSHYNSPSIDLHSRNAFVMMDEIPYHDPYAAPHKVLSYLNNIANRIEKLLVKESLQLPHDNSAELLTYITHRVKESAELLGDNSAELLTYITHKHTMSLSATLDSLKESAEKRRKDEIAKVIFSANPTTLLYPITQSPLLPKIKSLTSRKRYMKSIDPDEVVLADSITHLYGFRVLGF